jgi:hypothetical protein
VPRFFELIRVGSRYFYLLRGVGKLCEIGHFTMRHCHNG